MDRKTKAPAGASASAAARDLRQESRAQNSAPARLTQHAELVTLAARVARDAGCASRTVEPLPPKFRAELRELAERASHLRSLMEAWRLQ